MKQVTNQKTEAKQNLLVVIKGQCNLRSVDPYYNFFVLFQPYASRNLHTKHRFEYTNVIGSDVCHDDEDK